EAAHLLRVCLAVPDTHVHHGSGGRQRSKIAHQARQPADGWNEIGRGLARHTLDLRISRGIEVTPRHPHDGARHQLGSHRHSPFSAGGPLLYLLPGRPLNCGLARVRVRVAIPQFATLSSTTRRRCCTATELGLTAVRLPSNSRLQTSQPDCSARLRHAPGSMLSARTAAVARSSCRAPVTPSSTTSMGPATGYAATGTPQAIASRLTRPKVSVRLGNTNTSAAARCRASASPR